MHKSTGNGPVVETRWHYLGPDQETYGPYTSKDMMFWVQSGYFNESLQLRTEHESGYHTLGEWTQLLGTHPFALQVHSLEATMSQLNPMRPHGPHGPMMIMPPGLQSQFAPQMQMRFPPFMPVPMLHQMGPNGPPMGAPMHSQPPSEPIDAGSLSHTPDSETDGHVRKPMHTPMMHHLIPQMQNVQIATEPIITHEVECQTEPIEVSKEKAARLLSELIGQTVVIN